MGVVEYGPSGRPRGIVESEEREGAQTDASLFGFGYLYDGRRLDPTKLEIVLPADAPATMVKVLNEYIEKKDDERGSHSS